MRVGFGCSSVTFRPSRVFHSRFFSHPDVDTDEQSTGSCPRFYQIQNVVTNSFVLTMSLYAFISLLYKWFHSLPLLTTQLGIEATELDRVRAGGNTLKELEV